MADLADRECVPCKGGVPPLGAERIRALLAELEGWTAIDDRHLEKSYELKDFAAALDLVNRIGAIAEAENHHPDIFLAWGRVDVKIWTHKIDGLTESDFIFAAKCDRAAAGMAA